MATMELSADEISQKSQQEVFSDDDLLTEILLRLAPKPLLCFQIVSKKWLSIISDPRFRRRHSRRRHSSSTSFLFMFQIFHMNPELSSVLLDPRDADSARAVTSRMLTVLPGVKCSKLSRFHSCNGLLLLEFVCHWYRRHCVYNPITHQSRSIPIPKRPEECYHIGTMNLAFDPSKSDDWKIVCVWERHGFSHRFSVYSSGTGTWTDCSETFKVRIGEESYPFYFGSVFWNGNLHWVCEWGPFLCFDLENECLRPMPSTLIPEDEHRRYIQYFGESGGHLHLIEIHKPRGTLFDVLELERDYSKWFVKYRVDIDFLTTAFPRMVKEKLDPSNVHRYRFSLLSVLVDEKEEKPKLVIALPGKVISCFVNDTQFEELVDVKPSEQPNYSINYIRYEWYNAHRHIESLACV